MTRTMSYLECLKRQPVIPAPMCGISDFPWRDLCRQMGAELTFTQMVSAEGLIRGDEKTRDILDIRGPEPMLGVQVFGGEPDSLGEAAAILQEYNPVVIDLNMGCPVRKITVGNAGAALLKDLPRVRQIFKAMRKSITKVPFTVKMRWDWDDAKGTALDVAKLAEEEGVDGLALHARTREQGYSGKASWEMIARLKEQVSIPVIGNGDVRTPADAVRMIRETGCDSVMIGRGLIGDPWLMRDCLQAFERGTEPEERPVPTWEERRSVMLFHAQCMVDRRGPQGLKLFRKHAVAYLRGVRGGKRVRNLLMSVETMEALAEVLATEPEADCLAGNA